jgi:hypothetical protein
MSKKRTSQTGCSRKAKGKLGPSFSKIGRLQFMSPRASSQQQTAAVSLLYTWQDKSIWKIGALVTLVFASYVFFHKIGT